MKISKFTIIGVQILSLILLAATVLRAAEFYVDPINGSLTGNGSQTSPWSTLEEVWNSGKIESRNCSAPCSTTAPVYVTKNATGPVKPGDTIYLMSGYHGSLSITGGYNSNWITIKAYPGQTPKLKNVFLRSVSKWSFEGVSISPSYAPVFANVGWMFKIEDHSWTGPSDHVTLKDSSLFSVPDSSGWVTKEDWLNNASGGVHSMADYTTLENIQIKNAAFGVVFYIAHYSTIRRSTLNRLCYDGLWLFGSDYAKAEYNTIKGIFSVDSPDNHYDLIQTATVGKPNIGVEIRGNILIGYESKDQLFLGDGVQGIGCFDGWYENYIIENNLVVTNSYHGIALTGAKNSRIINNTVVTAFTFDGWPPNSARIGIYAHKDGTLGYGNIIRNNICDSAVTTDNSTIDHNLVTSDKISNFVNPDSFDFRLKNTSPAVNAGAIEYAPTISLNETTRDAQPDIGAHEYESINAPSPPVNFMRK